MTISDEMVETVARAIDDFEMPDGDPFGVLIFNSDYVLPSNMADMIQQKSQIIKSIARAALTAALQGSVVVPAEPTPAMIEAADIQDDEYYITNSAAFVTEIWQKMVAASQVSRHERGDTK